MQDRLRVVLEIGPKGRRVVAGAIDWPGLDRWGRDEDEAVARLAGYVPRYAAVAERAGMASQLGRQDSVEIVERYAGNTSTDYWGIAHVTSETEREILPAGGLERRLALLTACWMTFDAVAAVASADLRTGPRGGGWTRDELIRHVLLNEPQQFTRKVEVRTPREVMLTAGGLAAHRAATLDAIRAYNEEGRSARTWSIQFLIRRIAHHVMDHTWEMQDRDPPSS
jgi:hypothetical protein